MTTPQDTTEHKIVGGAREFWFSKKTMELNAWPSHHNTLPEYEMIRWYPSNEVNDLKAKHERVLQMLDIAVNVIKRYKQRVEYSWDKEFDEAIAQIESLK